MFIISTVMAYTQILVSGGKLPGSVAMDFILILFPAMQKENYFSPADTSIKDYLYTVVSIDTHQKNQ